jgi:transposase InsO family protein
MVIDRLNQVWCADITYIPMQRGFHYLVAIMDWSTRKVLSWRVSNTMDGEFCIEALEDALARFGSPEIFNTDSKSDGVGCFSRISFPGSVGRLSHQAVRFCLARRQDGGHARTRTAGTVSRHRGTR